MGFVSRLVPPPLIGHSQLVKVKAKQDHRGPGFSLELFCAPPLFVQHDSTTIQ